MRCVAYQARISTTILGVWLAALPTLGRAEIAAPSQLTPQSLRPESGPRDQGIVLSGQPAAAAPAGADRLYVQVGDVVVDGAFSELAPQTAAFVRDISGKRVSVAQIYAFASTLERSYAEAGYTLARVVVPPQNLVDQGRLVVVVVDGFIEDINVDGVPERVRGVVAARAGFLVGLRHVRLSEIERQVLLAGDIPGLKLKSTLMRGASDGGVKLVLEGEHRLVSGSLGTDDRLASSLGTWQLRGAVALNSAFGSGEQIYGTLGLGSDLSAALAGSAPLKVYGGGAVIPVGDDGITLNPEYTRSTTRTAATPGVPASLGGFERFALRLRDPVLLTRQASVNLNASLEYVTQKVSASAFDTALNSDRYGVIRVGPDYTTTLPWGTGLQLGTTLSQGLGGRTEADAAASYVPLSRAGAGPDFTKITATAHLTQPLPNDMRFELIGSGQLSMGAPLLRSEQFALDGTDAVSAFAAGTFSADQGATLRGELIRPFAARFDAINATLSPYLFNAVGRGWLFNVTSVEQPRITASALGVGLRTNVQFADNTPGLTLGFELGRQYSNVPGLRQGWRANVNASAGF